MLTVAEINNLSDLMNVLNSYEAIVGNIEIVNSNRETVGFLVWDSDNEAFVFKPDKLK